MGSKKTEDGNYFGSLRIKTQNEKTVLFKWADDWLEDKKVFDGAEGLWRIHDNLYDLNKYIDKHPGGKFWLKITKGLDITEAFESYHLSTKPEQILKSFFKRKAITSRNTPFTFEENGFYRTLKRNVREVWKDIPKTGVTASKIIIDVLFVITIVVLLAATFNLNYRLGSLAGIIFSLVNICAHNFYHQKDNIRMYYSDIGLSPSREWRIIHILSHHMHSNSTLDIQAYLLYPMVLFYPEKKTAITKYLSYIYIPMVLWPTIFIYVYFCKIYHFVVNQRSKHLSKTDLLPWTLPTILYLITNQPLLSVLQMWLFVMAVNGFCFSLIGLATTHYHPDIFMDGDRPRCKDEMDWGINQLDTVGDKIEVHGSHFMGLISFGDHALHHLFPCLDHGVLNHLYPVVERTLNQFNLSLRITNLYDLVTGHFLQLSKEIPNENSPILTKKHSTYNKM